MAKQTFGKDDNGTFHPRKGKPSGVNKVEGLGLQATDPDKMDNYIEITEKYTLDADTLDPSVPIRHPNRNTSKGEDTYKAKENKPQSDKTKEDAFTEERPAVVAEELPGVLTRDRFKELAEYRSDCCVSIFLPSHAYGVEINQQFDEINLKNQLEEVNRMLLAKGYNEAYINPLLEPVFDLLRNDAFWNELSPGLAIFIAEGFFKFIKMPVPPVEEALIIEQSFYVTPLVPVMECKEYFYVLVISKHAAKLFKGDAWSMQKITVELPQGIDAVKRFSEQDATTFRSGSSGSRAPRASQEGSYHGVGGGIPDEKDNLLVYFEAVDDILWEKVFNKENAPLLLAGVEYEIPIYRKACDYHNVWPTALTGNREHQDIASLYKDSKEIMQPYFDQRLFKALDLYMNNSVSSKTSSIAADVIPAAYYAQVSHLFVCKGEHLWGTFDEMQNKLVFHDSADEEGENLIDNAVEKTLSNGGEVFLLEKEKMPAETQIAAIMRY